MDKLSNIFCSIARWYRTINKPQIRCDINSNISIYEREDSDDAKIDIKIKANPKIKLFDFIISFFASFFIINLFFAMIRFLKNIFR